MGILGGKMMRIGIGYDMHQLAENRRLILGGVEIPFNKGLLGHSDADVLTHAINDALLGAAALGDIGIHFPDNDPKYKDISSLLLLKKVKELLKKADYQVVNIDTVICAEKPKLAPYIEQMRKNLAECLEINMDQVSVKATTSEKMGFVGREEGIAVQAVCMIEKKI